MKFEKEIYQEYDYFTVYNVYKIINEENNKKVFLYRTSISKIKDKYIKKRKELNKMDALTRGEI
jgi:hypothetical protein